VTERTLNLGSHEQRVRAHRVTTEKKMTFDEWAEDGRNMSCIEREFARDAWRAAVAAEREACAKACDFEVCGSQGFVGPTCCILPPGHDGAHKYGVAQAKTQRECAAAIRARSNVGIEGPPKAVPLE
jgi:hypothetical protein